RSRITVAHSGIALHVEPWRSPCSWPAIANSLNSELRHDVVRVRAFRGVANGKPRNAERHHIHHARAHDSVPRNVSLLRKIVVIRPETRQVDGPESIFTAPRISRVNLF